MSIDYGFIGLGNMGGPMAARLVEQGHPVVVFDIDHRAAAVLGELGAGVAENASSLAEQADVVLVCLPSVSASIAVADEVAEVSGAGAPAKTYVEMSTIGKHAALEIAHRLATHGVAMVDAPVSGGGEAVRRGALTIMASGPRAAFERARPGLEAIGKRVFYVSERQGLAQVMKLLNNMCSIGQTALAIEACAFGVKAGLDPDVMLEVLNASSGRSGASRFVLPEIVTRRYRSGATMQIASKDVSLCVAEAEREGVPMWLGAMVAQLWRHGVLHAGGDADMTHLADLVEQWAGVEMRTQGGSSE